MRTFTKTLFLPPLPRAAFALMLASRLTAQSFTILHSFTATDPSTGVRQSQFSILPVILFVPGFRLNV